MCTKTLAHTLFNYNNANYCDSIHLITSVNDKIIAQSKIQVNRFYKKP